MAVYLVTGGVGFIGSSLATELIERGETVRILDNFLTGSHINLAHIAGKIKVFEHDIRELEQIRPAFDGVDYVLHQAALPSVPRSIEDPARSNSINVQGTLNVLIAARDAHVKRLVYAASSSAYGDTPVLPKREDMPDNPLSPYAVSKLTGEQYCKVFTYVYGLETVCLRYFNVFGPRQDPSSPYSGVLSLFITALLNGKRPKVYGNGETSRDFSFVANAVHANLLACTAKDAAGRMFNIANGEQHSLNQVLEILGKLLQTKADPIYEPPRRGDILHSLADISLAGRVLAYKPLVNFEEGLRRTLDWYRENR